MAAETDAERNGMTEAEWELLPEDARAWRSEHPRVDPRAELLPVAQQIAPIAELSLTGSGPLGGTIVLTGDAQAAARGELHRSMELNTAARDAAVKL